jgi:hypothetical protein
MSFESSEISAAGENSIPIGINGHDIHCKARYPQLINVELCLWCNVIRTIRDENELYALSAYNNGYMDGYNDAKKTYFDEMHSFVENLGDDLL